MKEYRFSEENAKKAAKSHMISRIPLMLAAIIGSLYITNSQNEGMIFGDSIVLISTLSLTAFGLTIGSFFGIKNGTKSLMQNIYRVSDSGIEWSTPSGKSLIIDFNNIDMHESDKKGLLIKAKNQ